MQRIDVRELSHNLQDALRSLIEEAAYTTYQQGRWLVEVWLVPNSFRRTVSTTVAPYA